MDGLYFAGNIYVYELTGGVEVMGDHISGGAELFLFVAVNVELSDDVLIVKNKPGAGVILTSTVILWQLQ